MRKQRQNSVEAGLADVRIGVVTGDDVLPKIVMQDILLDPSVNPRPVVGLKTSTLDSRFRNCRQDRQCQCLLGRAADRRCFADGARIVITGRVADASLTVGPAMHEFGGNGTIGTASPAPVLPGI